VCERTSKKPHSGVLLFCAQFRIIKRHSSEIGIAFYYFRETTYDNYEYEPRDRTSGHLPGADSSPAPGGSSMRGPARKWARSGRLGNLTRPVRRRGHNLNTACFSHGWSVTLPQLAQALPSNESASWDSLTVSGDAVPNPDTLRCHPSQQKQREIEPIHTSLRGAQSYLSALRRVR
jgi:hypothetical protein